MKDPDRLLAQAYRYCKTIALGHYENFPVGSILVPAHLRKHFFALYGFMRTADDFADLPGRVVTDRLKLLDDWRTKLHAMFAGATPQNPIFLALRDTTCRFHLAQEPFDLLLDAFEFDARGDVAFETYDDLHWYTQRSAEPVGQLVLALFGYRDDDRIGWSNDICSVLQIINFLQDAREDLSAGRVYFPREVYAKFGITTGNEILNSNCAAALVLSECDRIEGMLRRGMPLIDSVKGRFKWELRAVISGAFAMLDKIREMKGETMKARPNLSALEKTALLFRSFIPPRIRGV